MTNLHTKNGVRSAAQVPGIFSQQIYPDLVSRIWLHEGQHVTIVVVNPNYTFIALNAAKQKNNFLGYDCYKYFFHNSTCSTAQVPTSRNWRFIDQCTFNYS